MARGGRKALALVGLTLATMTVTTESEAAGRSSSAVVNTILNGKGAPKSSLGSNGDFYIDTRSLLLYGPKSKGKWPAPQSMQGPTGASGSDGKNGADGKAISNASINSGVKGEQGEKGEKGDQGLPGIAGAPGIAGVMGPAGPAGAVGPAGSNGSNGSNGAAGATGATGAQGLTGAKGETGTTGPSEVTVINVPEFTLETSIRYTYISSELFGTLKANNSYSFQIFLQATTGTTDMILGVDMVAAGGALQFNYLRSDYRLSTYSTALNSYGFLISGTIAVGATNSSLAVRVIDAFGLTGANPLTFTGKAYITLVGSIR